MTRYVLVFVLLLIPQSSPSPDTSPDETPLALRILPAFQFEPGTVSYRIQIAPHRDNFWFCMGWTNRTTLKSRTSCQQLNGIYSPRVVYQDYRDLAPGTYDGFVDLYRVPNHRSHTATQAFVVVVLKS